MKQNKRQAYLSLVERMAEERSDFCPMLCNICVHFVCWSPEEFECAHPVERMREQVEEDAYEGGDCWAWRPRTECRTLEAAEAFIRSGAVDARDCEEETWASAKESHETLSTTL